MIHFILLSAFLTILISIHASSIKLENLLNIGCTSCLSFKFGAAPSECFGPYLFIGALNSSGGVFHRGTLDFSQAAVPTHPREIVWKFSPGFSFGLAVDKSRLLREDTNLLGSDQDELNRQRKTNGVSFYQSTSGWERLVLNCPEDSSSYFSSLGDSRTHATRRELSKSKSKSKQKSTSKSNSKSFKKDRGKNVDEDIDIVRENAEKGGMVQGQVEKVEGSKGEETEERKIGRKKGGKSDGEMERKRHEEMEIAKEEERIEGGDGDDNILGRGEGDDNTDGEGDDEVEGEGDGDGDDDIEREGDGNDDIGREGDGDDDIERDGDDDIEGEGEGEGGSEIEGAQEGQGGGGDLVAVSVSLRGVTAAANSPSPSIVPISAPTSKPGPSMWITIVLPLAIVSACLVLCVVCFSGKEESDGQYRNIDECPRAPVRARDGRVFVSSI